MSFLHDVVFKALSSKAKVLDLGCGDGSLLARLVQEKSCTGYGIEIDDDNVQKCLQHSINVIQLNLEEGLALIEDNAFDWVLQINTLQHLRNTEVMLQETARVASKAVVAFPNFAHWPNRFSVIKGHMPITKTLPYEWYDTPNIRVGTFFDFKNLAEKNGLRIKEAFGLSNTRRIRLLPNLRASTAFFVLERVPTY